MLLKVRDIEINLTDSFENDCLNRRESAEVLTQFVTSVMIHPSCTV
jgi:hypothetical protein